MDLKDLDRIGFVTRHFQDLKGLQVLVPLGMIVLLQGSAPLLVRLPDVLCALCMAGWFAVAMLVMFGSKRFYRKRLGEVRHKTTVGEWLPMVVVAACAAAYLLVTHSLSPPRAVGLLYGSALLGCWLRREMRVSQLYHLLLGSLLLGIALLVPGDSPLVRRPETYALCGISWILAGLLDHRQLMRTLGRFPLLALEAEAAPEPAETR
jgi:hypothetical protein